MAKSNVAALAAGAMLIALVPQATAAGDSQPPRAILVCNGSTAPCPPGTQHSSIQKAVDVAQPGDWILIWPGVYHEKGTSLAGVLITKPGLHLRGLDRNLVVVDGSNGSASGPCPSDPALQDFNGGLGRNGIEVFKVDGVSVENLTICDYLASAGGDRGNELWFNGGDGSGQIGMHAYQASYVSATSMYFKDASSPMAQYGIFASNAAGPGRISHAYSSNMGDAAYYVGACPDCNAVLDRVQGEHSALGYSGTNSGGHLVIQNSEWDDNRAGIVPNSLNNEDAPPPQSGLCPDTSTQSCTMIRGNFVHDNNDPNVPAFGISSSSLVGAGIEISGGMFDTLVGNRIERQGSWGIVIHDFPDAETPPPISHCQGGIQLGPICYFNATGNVVTANRLADNGFFGNPSNGDLANQPPAQSPRNCFFANTDAAGLTSDPAAIQTVDGPPCDQPGTGGSPALTPQLYCAAGLLPPSCGSYPQQTRVTMLALPPQATMPDPCAAAPANLWCQMGFQPSR